MESKFKFLAKNSLLKKVKNKWFLVVNIILLIVIVSLTNIDSIVKLFGGDFNKSTNIIIIDETGYYNEIRSNLSNLSKYINDGKVIIKKEDNIKQAKKSIKGKKDIILKTENDYDNIFKVEFITDSYVDMVKYQTIISSLNSAKESIALSNSSIDKNELSKIKTPINVTRTFINKDKNKDEETSRNILSILSLVVVLPCFMLIMFLVQMIGAEINEEKSSRCMEIIIGNVPVKTHFFSKVFASNIFVIMQGALLFVYGIIGLLVRKIFSNGASSLVTGVLSGFNLKDSIDILTNNGFINKLGYIIPLVIILIILNFLAYSLLSGILASMTTNMENYQQLQTPIMVINVLGYYLIFLSTAFPGSIFIKVISCIPLISISLAPSLLISGEITVSIVIVAILLVLLLDYLLIKYGFRIYKVGILNYRETNLWKKIFKAIKEK